MAIPNSLPAFRRPLVDDPMASYTLPARFYTDPAIYELEKRAIFYRTWQYLGHVSHVARPGDYVAGYVADQRVFAIRGQDGKVRAFQNTCQHRGHHLVKGSGNVGLFVTCPYHAWAYDTTGRLRTARNCDHLPDFRKEDFSLPEVRVEAFCGFLFVNLDPGAKPLAELVPDLEADIRARVPEIDRLKPVGVLEFGGPSMKANWKVVVDNYLECYHCPPAHPAFAEMLDMPRYRMDEFGLWSRQLGVRTNATRTIYPVRPDHAVQEAMFWYLWPTTTINMLPGSTEIQIAAAVPRGHDQSSFAGHVYTADGGAIYKERYDYVNDILGIEDRDLCESVQEGLHALGYDQGRFVVDKARSGISEHALHRFHLLVKDALNA